MQDAHKTYLRGLVNTIKSGNITDIFISGCAHNDDAIALARAQAVSDFLTALDGRIPPTLSISTHNSASLRAGSARTDAYWRGVDVKVFMASAAPVPQPLPQDRVPPMPGSANRFSDWEVYAEWGCSFNPLPMAMVSLNAYHFRRKAPNTAHGVWCGTVQFGVGQSIEIAKAFKLARLVKAAGVSRVLGLLSHVPGGAPKPIKDAVMSFAKTLVGSISDPSYSDAPAVTPFSTNDLNGATAFGDSESASAFIRSTVSARLTVTQKMPQYEFKFIDTRTPPRWVMVRHRTVNLLENVDIGGPATNLPTMPSVSASFVGGPLIAF